MAKILWKIVLGVGTLFVSFVIFVIVYVMIDKHLFFADNSYEKILNEHGWVVAYVPDGDWNIFVVKPNGNASKKVPNIVAPSGSNVTFDLKGNGYACDNGKILKFNLSKGGPPAIVQWKNGLDMSEIDFWNSIAVTPDNSLLAFSLNKEIVIVKTDGKLVFRTGLNAIWKLSWSPDSTKLSIRTEGKIIVINAFTLNRTDIPLTRGYWPDWISNREIGFWKDQDEWLIWSSVNVDTPTKERELFKTRQLNIMGSSVSPDGKYVIASAILNRWILPVSCPVIWDISTGKRYVGKPLERKSKTIFLLPEKFTVFGKTGISPVGGN